MPARQEPAVTDHRITPEWGPADLAMFAAVIVAWTLALGLTIIGGVAHETMPYTDLAIAGAGVLSVWVIAARRYRSLMNRMGQLEDSLTDAVEGGRRLGYGEAVTDLVQERGSTVTSLPSARRPGA